MRFRAAFAVLEDELWVISGCRVLPHAISDERSRASRHDPSRDAWGARAPLAQPRRGAVAAVVRGGRGGSSRRRSSSRAAGAARRCSRPSRVRARGGEGGAGAWRALPPLPCATWYAMSAALGGEASWSAARAARACRRGTGARGACAPTCPPRATTRAARCTGRLTLFGGVVADGAGARATTSVIAYDAAPTAGTSARRSPRRARRAARSRTRVASCSSAAAARRCATRAATCRNCARVGSPGPATWSAPRSGRSSTDELARRWRAGRGVSWRSQSARQRPCDPLFV